MTIRRKIAAGLGGMTLLLGTLGGAVAVGATSNHATTPPAAVQTGQSGQADAETADGPDATTGQDVPDASGAQDTPEVGDTPDAPGTATGPDANNDPTGSGTEAEDGGSDAPVVTAP